MAGPLLVGTPREALGAPGKNPAASAKAPAKPVATKSSPLDKLTDELEELQKDENSSKRRDLWLALEEKFIQFRRKSSGVTAAKAADEPEPEPSATFDDRLEELATQMAEAIGRQMAYELPTLIEATLLNAEEGLRTGITATMDAALRDFIARRKQLQLPLDEPGSE